MSTQTAIETLAHGWLADAHAALLKSRYEEADHLLSMVLKVATRSPDIWAIKARVLAERQLFNEAKEAIEQALAYKPSPFGMVQLSRALSTIGEDETAIQFLKEVVANISNGEAHRALGEIYLKLERYREAIEVLTISYNEGDDSSEIFALLGYAYAITANLDKAVDFCDKAINKNPLNENAWNYIGLAFGKLNRLQDAAKAFQRNIVLNPNYISAYTNLAGVLNLFQDYIGARRAAEAALELKPDSLGSMLNLANALGASGKYEESLKYYEKIIQIDPAYQMAWTNMLLQYNYVDFIDKNYIFQRHLEWGGRFPVLPRPLIHNSDLDKPLKVGFLSPDLRDHSVGLFVEGLWAHLDKNKFLIYGYLDRAKEDETTARFRSYATLFQNVAGLKENEILDSIRKDDIDILIELAGHTGSTLLPLMAQRPAPVQIHWLGYPNTTGLSIFDARISDSICEPPGEADSLSSEPIYRMDPGFHCYTRRGTEPDVQPTPALRNGYISFGSFNNRSKITNKTFDLWVRVLNEVPGSRFIIKAFQMADKNVRESIIEEFSNRGIDPDRIAIFRPSDTYEMHMAGYGHVDIALDTVPYNGTTTTVQALYMGVPVVAILGSTHASRVSASLLCQMGLNDLVGEVEDDYVAIAARLASDVQQLDQLRQSIRGRMEQSPLLDQADFARRFGIMLREVWQRVCREVTAGKP